MSPGSCSDTWAYFTLSRRNDCYFVSSGPASLTNLASFELEDTMSAKTICWTLPGRENHSECWRLKCLSQPPPSSAASSQQRSDDVDRQEPPLRLQKHAALQFVTAPFRPLNLIDWLRLHKHSLIWASTVRIFRLELTCRLEGGRGVWSSRSSQEEREARLITGDGTRVWKTDLMSASEPPEVTRSQICCRKWGNFQLTFIKLVLIR